jgi:hypothetical protein
MNNEVAGTISALSRRNRYKSFLSDRGKTMKGRGTVIGLFGLWLILAGIWRFGAIGEMWSNLISGIIIAILGFSLVRWAPGNGWISGLIGVWMIIAAFIPGLRTGGGLVANNVISGIVLAIAGFSVPRRRAVEEPGIRRAA